MAPVKNTTSIAKPTIPGELRIKRVQVLTGSGRKRMAWSLETKGLEVTGGTQPKIADNPGYEASDTEIAARDWIKWINEDLATAFRRAKLIINGIPMIDETSSTFTEQDRQAAKVIEEHFKKMGISVSIGSKSMLREEINFLVELLLLNVPSSKNTIVQAENILTTAIAKARRELDKMWESGWRDYAENRSKYNS